MPLNYFDKGTNMGVDFGLPVLPAFTSGIFYTLSRDVVKMITEFPYPQRYVDDDGVNLAIWLFGFNIEPMHDRRIQSGKDVCEKDLVAKKVDYHPKDMKAMYTSISNQQSICHGFRHETCGLCYPCYEKTNNWRADNLHCDPERGVSLTKQPDFIQMAGPNVKDMLEPSKIGDSDRWIIPDILSTRSSVYSETDKWHLLYWVCWTSDPSTFTDRHWRALEMVWIHEPEAAIIMMTNTLPTNFFQDYTRRGYNIQVVQFNKQNLLNWNWYFGPGTKDWIADWDKWEKGKFFYWHLTDYIRLLLLYNYGGTYMDMDALWIRVPPDTNQEFIGSDYSSLMSDREWTLDDQGLYLPQGLMRFKRGWKLFREMAEDAFSAYTYDPECFNCGGPKAITSYVRKRRGVLESAGFTILPRKTFYPFNYLEIHHLLEPNPLAEQEMKKNIEPYSWNIHLFGKMTNNLPVQPGSVIDFVFKKFDLDLPHRDTKTHNIISSSHGWTVPFALVGPRDYVFQQLTDRMMEDDRKRNNTLILQQKIGRFQGLNVIYVRGGPDKYDDVKINLETTIGRNRFSGNFTKHTSMHLKGASMKDVNSMLNRIEYQPTKLMAANGGRDKIKIQLEYQYGNTLAQEQLEFPVIVIEPLEENDDPLLDPLPSTKNK
jgi:hypothetical protein